MSKITNILIGVLIVSLMLTGIMSFMSEGVNKYSPTGYNGSRLNNISEKFEAIHNISERTKSKLENATADDSNIFEKFSAFVSGGWSALLITGESFDTLNEMADLSIDEVGVLGNFGTTLKIIVPIIILIIIFIGILAHFLLKSDRL